VTASFIFCGKALPSFLYSLDDGNTPVLPILYVAILYRSPQGVFAFDLTAVGLALEQRRNFSSCP